MKIPFLLRVAAFALGAVFPALGVASEDPGAGELTPLSIEDLFRPAMFARAQLSPDGRHVGAIVAGDDDLRGLLILGFDGDKPQALRGERGLDLAGFNWLDNDHVLFEVARSKLYSNGIYVADRTKLHRSHRLPAQFLTGVLSAPRRRPGHVLAMTAPEAAGERFLAPSVISSIDRLVVTDVVCTSVKSCFGPSSANSSRCLMRSQAGLVGSLPGMPRVRTRT